MKNFVYTKIVFLLIFTLLLSAQPKGRRGDHKVTHTPINLETHIIKADSIFTCFISYRVAFNNLLFVRENGNYVAGFTIAIVIVDGEAQIERLIKTSTTVVSDYDETLRDDLFIEDLMNIELQNGEYTFRPIFSILNTDIELPLPSLEVVVDTTQVFRPIVVYNEKIESDDSSYYRLANQKNSIPYSVEDYDILIPVYDSPTNSIDLIIDQDGERIIETILDEFEEASINFAELNNQIVLKNNRNMKSAKLFKYSAVNEKLNEGHSKIKILIDNKDFEFTLPVFWNNKPRSLRNPEMAIELLKIIGKNDQADSLFDFDEKEYYDVLYNYWKKYDNDAETGFNEVFAEFYSRVDHANKNFKSLSGDVGAKSDRGLIYIKFGKPDSIERTYNEQYNIIEIWKYNSINKKVIFADHTGTGNFVRIK